MPHAFLISPLLHQAQCEPVGLDSFIILLGLYPFRTVRN